MALFAPGFLAHGQSTPLQLFGANLVGWWRGDAGLSLSGSTVTSWTDQSANGRVLTQTGPSSNLITKDTTTIGNSKTSLFMPQASSPNTLNGVANNFPALGGVGGFTIFIVAHPNSLGNTSDAGRYLSFTPSSGAATDWGDANGWLIPIQLSSRPLPNETGFWNSYTATSTPPKASVGVLAVGSNYRFGFTHDGAGTVKAYKNGALVQTNTGQTIGMGTTGTLVMNGQKNNGNNEGLNAAVAEIVIVNRAPSAGELTALDNYFKGKWAL